MMVTQNGAGMIGSPEYIEEEEEEEDFWPLSIRYELIEYLLRRYGALQARDIARILGCKMHVVQQVLRQLERSGKVNRAKIGRNFVYSPKEESHGFMYY